MKSLKNAYNNSCLDITLGTVGSENHFELYHQFKRLYEIKNGETYGCYDNPSKMVGCESQVTDEIAKAPFWTVC